MRSKRATIIDYGLSNTLSIFRALEFCGAQVELTDSPLKIKSADYLILPGVGAFGDGMNELVKRNLIPAIRSFVASGKYFLGICLGMQLMFESSSEFGKHDGLGLVPGSVDLLPAFGVDGAKSKIPHISWNKVYPPAGDKNPDLWQNTILRQIKPNSFFYFVHSYCVIPKHPADTLALTPFYGHDFSSVIRRDNLYGAQFHPEKSGPVGLKILENFISLS